MLLKSEKVWTTSYIAETKFGANASASMPVFDAVQPIVEIKKLLPSPECLRETSKSEMISVDRPRQLLEDSSKKDKAGTEFVFGYHKCSAGSVSSKSE